MTAAPAGSNNWSQAAPVGLHYVRNKDGVEIDFALSHNEYLTHLIECKWADKQIHRAFATFMPRWPQAQAIQLLGHLRSPELCKGVQILEAAPWLAGLAT